MYYKKINNKGRDKVKKLSILLIFFLILITSSCQSINLYDDIINKVVEITCENEISKSYATGTLISNDGLILTNKHVIDKFDDKSTIKINFINDVNTYYASIYDISTDYDLCILKIDKTTDYFSKLSTNIYVGNQIYTIGNSNGYGLAYQQGVICSEYKNIIHNNTSSLVIQTNIEIYDGSSGGPLYNSKGELLGIMTFRIKDNGVYIPGMSFAIPTKIINKYLGGIKK